MNSVTMPKVMDYYISLQYRQLLNDKFINSDCEISDNKIYIVSDYDPDLFSCLKLFLEKTKKLTIGNGMHLYEFELDIQPFKGDQDFIIYLEDGTHICRLTNSYLDNNKMILILNIIS